MAQKLLMEHEMGELFKVIGFFRGDPGRRSVSPRVTGRIRCRAAPHDVPLVAGHLPGLLLINWVSPLDGAAGFRQVAGGLSLQAVRARVVHPADDHGDAERGGGV
jgi:hypothetical protein